MCARCKCSPAVAVQLCFTAAHDEHHDGAGYNVCIFAYGQTGSGKTHTMAGTNIEQYEGRGINYRALDDLFALNAKRQGEVRCMQHRDWHMLKPAIRMLFADNLAVANLELMSVLLTHAAWTSCVLRHYLLASTCSNP